MLISIIFCVGFIVLMFLLLLVPTSVSTAGWDGMGDIPLLYNEYCVGNIICHVGLLLLIDCD